MNSLILNKKAEDKLLSIWWFFILAVIGTGIVIGVLMYYNADVDVRMMEADILKVKIQNCLNQEGKLFSNLVYDNFDFLKYCGLDKDVFGLDSNFYIRVLISELETGKRIKLYINGSASYEKDCEVVGEVAAEKYPRCLNDAFILSYFDGEKTRNLKVETLVASNQFGKKISIGGKS